MHKYKALDNYGACFSQVANRYGRIFLHNDYWSYRAIVEFPLSVRGIDDQCLKIRICRDDLYN